MAWSLNKLFHNFLTGRNNLNVSFLRFKSKRWSLGKPPGKARSLKQRLEELSYKDPTVYFKVNIGYAPQKQARREISSERIKILKSNKNNPELESLARDQKLFIPLDGVEEEWSKTVGPYQIKSVAEHYSIFDHLFGDAYFYPVVPLKIHYDLKDGLLPVYRGNAIKPEQTLSSPHVLFDSKCSSLWTLIMTTPDGHFTSDTSEVIHWFIGNIKGNNLQTGQVVFDYLQALPAKGLGYLRYIFILYKQDKIIDYSDLKKSHFSGDMNERNFSTYTFYKEHQDYLTPAGLSFFTACWDQSVRNFHHEILNIESPEFIYDFPKNYYRKQEWFPLKQPFNLYLDRYRDEKEIAKEFLVKKLKALDPFKEPKPKLKYPNAVAFKPGTPSWLKNEIRKERLGWARAKDFEY